MKSLCDGSLIIIILLGVLCGVLLVHISDLQNQNNGLKNQISGYPNQINQLLNHTSELEDQIAKLEEELYPHRLAHDTSECQVNITGLTLTEMESYSKTVMGTFEVSVQNFGKYHVEDLNLSASRFRLEATEHFDIKAGETKNFTFQVDWRCGTVPDGTVPDDICFTLMFNDILVDEEMFLQLFPQ